jgi:hypothetical protein
MLLCGLLAAPSIASAQLAEPPLAADEPAAAAEAALVVPVRAAASAGRQQRSAPAPAPERRRRRPSMVGYIEDATVESRIRFRFDSGFGNEVPDRAEFFYAKCGCYKHVPPPAFDAEAPGPGGGIPNEIDYTEFYAYAERAVGDRFSVFADLPFRGIEPQGFVPTGLADWDSSFGIGDIRFGGKADLYSDGDRGLTALVRMAVPTGDERQGLGTNHASIEPSLLFHSMVNDRVGIEAQFGWWQPLGGSAGVDSDENFSGAVLTWGVGPSFDAFASDRLRVSPIVELVGWRVLGGFQTCLTCDADASGINIVNLKVGSRFTVQQRHSFYAGLGWHLTEQVWYDKLFRLEYRLGF